MRFLQTLIDGPYSYNVAMLMGQLEATKQQLRDALVRIDNIEAVLKELT